MEIAFLIICLISFAIIFGIATYLIKHIIKEVKLYHLFSKDDGMRKLMANDPKRFHISIVYLMTYMTRSNGDRVQRDKLEMIVRYIREVIPQEYHIDAIQALKYLTDRENGSGKNRKTESLVNVDAFMSGDSCINNGDNSFHYVHDLHGRRMAAELASYMTEDDRKYVMYLLYRLAIADGVITTIGSKSEMYMLNRLCVNGLKIDKNELHSLIDAFKNRNDQMWYDQHFCNKENSYPSSDVMADIFRMDVSSLPFLERKVPKTSVLGSVIYELIIICFLSFGMFLVFDNYEDDLMGNVCSEWIFIVALIYWIGFLCFVCDTDLRLESSLVPVLRTKIENNLQRRGIITYSVLSILSVCFLLWLASNTLFLVGNKFFSNPEQIIVTRPVTDTYTTTTGSKHRKTTHYHVKFPEVSFLGKSIEKDGKREVSVPNKLCLQMLSWLSFMELKGVENTKTMTSLEVDRSTYSQAIGKNIQLYYKVGYFGLIYCDGYKLVDKNVEFEF